MTRDQSYKPASTLKDATASLRHPATAAWEQFRMTQPSLFAGPAHGWTLDDRLNAAFEQGWNAATKAILDALGRIGAQRLPIDQLEFPSDLAAKPHNDGDGD